DGAQVPDVRLEAEAVGPRGARRLGGSLGELAVDVHGDHVRTLSRESEGHRATDAVAGSRDDGDPIGERHAVFGPRTRKAGTGRAKPLRARRPSASRATRCSTAPATR